MNFRLEKKVYNVPIEIEEYVAELKLKSMGISIDKLTKEQEKYLKSWEVGTFYKKIPTFFDLENAFKKGSVCEVTLDARTLDGKDGFSMHRVVILDIINNSIIFHDPRLNELKPARVENKKLFIKSWLNTAACPKLCIYSK